MIISASRRTDIPAFHGAWWMGRVREGFCVTRNPFNPRQETRVSLAPENVDAVIFWTRDARPLMASLDEMDARGFRYYFHVTLMDNPRWLDPHTPSLERALEMFLELSQRLGPRRVIWRYDPVVLTTQTPPSFHCDAFGRIAERLRGATQRVMVSLYDEYAHTARKMRELAAQGIGMLQPEPQTLEEFLPFMRATAERNAMRIFSCSEIPEVRGFGIEPGACVDGKLIGELFGVRVSQRKDPNQRAACGCVASKDIGEYGTCRFGCRYCYASRAKAMPQPALGG